MAARGRRWTGPLAALGGALALALGLSALMLFDVRTATPAPRRSTAPSSEPTSPPVRTPQAGRYYIPEGCPRDRSVRRCSRRTRK